MAEKKKVNLPVHWLEGEIGEIGENIGEYRGNTGVACTIFEKFNINISSKYGMIWGFPGTEILAGVSFQNPPEHFCISLI